MYSKYKLAKSVDKTVPRVRWVASLSNGETIYENIIKNEKPAWERLRNYCYDNDLEITNLRLQLDRGREVGLPPHQEGYLQKKIGWAFGWDEVSCGESKCIGYVQGDKALIHEVDSVRGSRTLRGVPNPGEPFVIYKLEKRKRDGAKNAVASS